MGSTQRADGGSSQYLKLLLRNVIAKVLLTAESYLVGGRTACQQLRLHNRIRASALELTQRWLHPKQQLAHKCTLSGYKLRAESGDLR